MSLEIEAKFMEINVNDLRKKIKENGVKKVHKMVMYKRYVFNLLNKKEKGYIRVRDENGRTTMTVKKYPTDSKFAQEYEILLDKSSSIDDAKELLLAQGYKIKAYQESLREKWSMKGCQEIVIDTIPGIPTYVEIECEDENKLNKVTKILGFDMKDAKYGPFVNQYIDYYDINIDDGKHPNITFSNIDKELKPKKDTQKEFLIKVKKDNLDLIKKNKIIM
jgi:adenylate cyclase class 2